MNNDLRIKPCPQDTLQQKTERPTSLTLHEGAEVSIQTTMTTDIQRQQSTKVAQTFRNFLATILYGITFGLVDLRSKISPIAEPSPEDKAERLAKPNIPSSHHVLREFDLLKKLYENTDISNNSPLPKNFRQLVQAMRECGRRRSIRGENTLQHEARFLGITEVEYKNLLLRSGEKPPSRQIWQREIENERNIKSLLSTLSQQDPLDLSKLHELTGLLRTHPALAKPEYFAQLHLILQKAPKDQKEPLLEAMHKIGAGLNSRRILPFLEQVQAYLRKQGIEVGREILSPFFTEVQRPAEISGTRLPRDQILQWVAEDLNALATLESQIEDLQNNPLALKDAVQHIKSKHVRSILLSEEEDPALDLKERISLAKKKLENVRERQQDWKDHPERAISYFHATPSYKQTLGSKVAVTGEGRLVRGHGMSYVGAFVAKRPLIKYGPVAIGFTREIELGSKAVNTFSAPGAAADDIWLGFNRAVATNPTAYRIGREVQQAMFKKILEQPEIQALPKDQLEALIIGLAHLLENNVDVKQTPEGHWEIILHTFDSETEIQAPQEMVSEIIASLSRAFQQFPKVQKACEALSHNDSIASSISSEFKEILQQSKHSPDTQEKPSHMAAVIAFDEEPLLQARLAREFKGSEESPPTIEQVREFCHTHIPETPVIPWTEAEICADYDAMLGLKEIRLRDQKSAARKISNRRYF